MNAIQHELYCTQNYGANTFILNAILIVWATGQIMSKYKEFTL